MLNLQTPSLLVGALTLTACLSTTLPAVEGEQAEPVVFNVGPIEAEPARELPAIVAVALPELVPTRPLAHLAPLWRHGEASGPPASTYAAVGETPVAMPASAARMLGLPDASVDLARVANPASRLAALAWAGPLLVLGSGTNFAGATTTSELIWTSPGTLSSYAHAISPRMLIASLYELEEDRLIAWALADGREQWRRFGKGEFRRIKKLWSDGERGYLLGDLGLLAFDPNTGATLWTSALGSSECGVASEGDVVVIEDIAGHRLLDAKTGDEIARLPALAASSCGWESYASEGRAPATISAGTLVAFDGPSEAVGPTLRAFDLTTRTQRWQATGFDPDVLVADRHAVYVARGRSVVALDAATGDEQAAIAIGSDFSLRVEPVGGAAGPLLVVWDDFGEWVLGRAELAPKPESFVISGRLNATGSMDPKRVAGVRVRVGDQIVVTDKRGRFSAKGQAIGVIVVESAVDPYAGNYDYDSDGYPPILITGPRVMLDGEGSYDLGVIEAFEVSIA